MTQEQFNNDIQILRQCGGALENGYIDGIVAYVRELEQLVCDVKLGRERVIAERDALQERVQKLEQEDAITELIAYERNYKRYGYKYVRRKSFKLVDVHTMETQ